MPLMRGVAIVLILLTQGVSAQPLAEARRVISADGSITEIVYALGAGDRLVGVDTTSSYPPAVRHLPKVGYLRALPLEGLLALEPDVLITTHEAAPEENLQRLERAGVPVVRFDVPRSAEDALERIRNVGAALGRERQAEALTRDLETSIGATTRARAQSGPGPGVLFLLAAGNHGVMVAGKDTAADALIQMLGARNVSAGVSGYKPANREAILATSPDAVVIAEARPGQFRIEDWPEIASLAAWREGHRYVGDSMLLLGFGPRLGEALADFSAALPPLQEAFKIRLLPQSTAHHAH
ncbi:heme/hemin ABC transporter substrate-binding protein [Marinobacter salicampi]|uniref:heme/hemin ABC transporter substrate-binding protein n=1 Tax=Marinobacter salicampi TaxID=435907 RepID=UPI001F5F67F8|nr:helical backbone metal receptor [Marinobacter salicampi]